MRVFSIDWAQARDADGVVRATQPNRADPTSVRWDTTHSFWPPSRARSRCRTARWPWPYRRANRLQLQLKGR